MEKQLFQTREFMLIHCYQIKKKSVVICNNSLKAKVVTFCHKRGPETCLELKKKNTRIIFTFQNILKVYRTVLVGGF